MLMGDSTDGIPGIPKVGEKTADKLLNNIQLQEMPQFVLEKYIEMFGIQEGISKFAETFTLVYILKNKEDVLRETNLTLSDLNINQINMNII